MKGSGVRVPPSALRMSRRPGLAATAARTHPRRYADRVDLGAPISYEVLEPGTPVFSSDGEQIGKVAHVLAAEDVDVFDGVVIGEHAFGSGHRFADADEIGSIRERGLVLTLDRAACERLPKPEANPAVMRDDPAVSAADVRRDKLRRAWDLISGNY